MQSNVFQLDSLMVLGLAHIDIIQKLFEWPLHNLAHMGDAHIHSDILDEEVFHKKYCSMQIPIGMIDSSSWEVHVV